MESCEILKNSIKLSIDLIGEDYLHFVRHHFSKKRFSFLLKFAPEILLVFSLGKSLFDYFYLKLSLSDIILSLLLFLIMYAFIRAFFKYKFSSSYYSKNYKNLLGPINLEISKNNIIYKSKSIEATVDISEKPELESTKNYYFIYTTPSQAYIIPKRIFSSEEQEKEFEKYFPNKPN